MIINLRFRNIHKTPKRFPYILICFLIFASSCKIKPEQSDKYAHKETDKDTENLTLNFNNTFFTVPSPHQTTLIIEQNKLVYKNNITNPPLNLSKYTTNLKKALNLGVYGTDLGYLNIYNRLQDSYIYFSAVKKLIGDLQITDVFDPGLLSSVEKNAGNEDSLIFYISKIYQYTDMYLMSNDRNDIGSLIIAGGWIESLYLITQYYKDHNSPELYNQIGNQKYSLDNLIKLLSPYYERSKEFSLLIDDFVDLAYEFDVVDFTYTYKKAEDDTVKKIITIKSKSEVYMSASHAIRIAEKVKAIRTRIIN
jgi:hypothetical protein